MLDPLTPAPGETVVELHGPPDHRGCSLFLAYWNGFETVRRKKVPTVFMQAYNAPLDVFTAHRQTEGHTVRVVAAQHPHDPRPAHPDKAAA